MSYPDWPAELPRITRPGYGEGRVDVRERVASDLGAPRYRRRRTLVTRVLDAQMVLSRAEKQILDRFFAETTAEGSSYFRLADPMVDGWDMLDEAFATLLDENDVPLLYGETVLAAFGDEPPRGVQLRGWTFTVEFQLVLMP